MTDVTVPVDFALAGIAASMITKYLRIQCGEAISELQILVGQVRHEISVMDDERFGGSFYEIAFACMRGDDVADRIR
jgi:hypothetical protein